MSIGESLEVVPGVVEIENGGSSGPGGVAWTAFHHERRNRHEKKGLSANFGEDDSIGSAC